MAGHWGLRGPKGLVWLHIWRAGGGARGQGRVGTALTSAGIPRLLSGAPATAPSVASPANGASPESPESAVKAEVLPRAASGLYASSSAPGPDAERDVVANTLKVVGMVQQFRTKGHLVAVLDPLRRPGLTGRGPYFHEKNQYVWPDATQLLALIEDYPQGATLQARAEYLADRLGLEGAVDPERRWFVNGAVQRPAEEGVKPNPWDRAKAREPQDWWQLPELFEFMRNAYCRTLTAEMTHLHTAEQQEWLARAVEHRRPLPRHVRRDLLFSLMRVHAFEHVLGKHFPSSKRFGIEGCEAVIPGLEAIARRCAELGVTRVEMGMAHRGRLNVLHNVLRKPMGLICSEMEGAFSEVHVGDVKYHMGNQGKYSFFPSWVRREGGADDARAAAEPHDEDGILQLDLSLAPNPSHLEAVGPVVMGMVRAQQARLRSLRTDRDRQSRIMGLLIHGDAAFAALGGVYEALSLSGTPGYTSGGTVHVVINNQVGFTTVPREGRSGVHCTDIAKVIGAAVLHANADDPEAVWKACEIAAEFRQKFLTDAVVDIVGYRRHGHNELEDPSPCLPITYARVRAHPPVLHRYRQRLIAEGVVTQEEVDMWQRHLVQELEKGYEQHRAGEFTKGESEWVTNTWQASALAAIAQEGDSDTWYQENTGLPIPTLAWVGERTCTVPDSITLHDTVADLYARRRKMVEGPSSRVDWAMAEALAFGTLALRQGVKPPDWEDLSQEEKDRYFDPALGLNRGHYKVRLSGQDVERGTFNQRHFAVFDQTSAERYVPLSNISPRQEPVMLHNSVLNEGATLAFEYGYSLGMRRRGLTIWEAQFGDFANGAQVVVDEFISSGEEKWGQETNLVMLLPHGYDGQGPDHSSARMERFLQLLNDDADFLPGNSPADLKLISDTFEQITRKGGDPHLNRADVMRLLEDQGLNPTEAVDLVWQELGLAEDAALTRESWTQLMTSYLRRNSERNANMYVLVPSTPAQYFHALRRQVNLPFAKPCIIFSPKYLLHHRPCTSALADFAPGHFFKRIIDDNNPSDNTRHHGVDPSTGKPYLVPADQVRRVVICCGQVYYKLSHARRQRRIRDIVLVRLEQVAPFPHDKLTGILGRYEGAEVMWCQEEPKNMGAWNYVKPRLSAAMREQCARMGREPRRVHYCGRPASASPATASLSIHLKETREICDQALTLG